MATNFWAITRSIGDVPNPVPISSGKVETPATTTRNGTAVPANAARAYWVLTPSGGDQYIKFGDSGSVTVSTSDFHYYLKDGVTREFRAMPGQEVAILDA